MLTLSKFSGFGMMWYLPCSSAYVPYRYKLKIRQKKNCKPVFLCFLKICHSYCWEMSIFPLSSMSDGCFVYTELQTRQVNSCRSQRQWRTTSTIPSLLRKTMYGSTSGSAPSLCVWTRNGGSLGTCKSRGTSMTAVPCFISVPRNRHFRGGGRSW